MKSCVPATQSIFCPVDEIKAAIEMSRDLNNFQKNRIGFYSQCVFLRLNFCGLLALVAVFYFEMERKWNIFKQA